MSFYVETLFVSIISVTNVFYSSNLYAFPIYLIPKTVSICIRIFFNAVVEQQFRYIANAYNEIVIYINCSCRLTSMSHVFLVIKKETHTQKS